MQQCDVASAVTADNRAPAELVENVKRRIKCTARMDEVTRGGRNLHSENFHDLCWVMKSRKGGGGGWRGTWHVGCVSCVQIVFETLNEH